MHSGESDWVLPQPGFPIRTPPDQRSFASSPELIAGYNVLLRFSMPRHPPYTLKSLTTFTDHRLSPLPLKSLGPCGLRTPSRSRPAGRAGRPTTSDDDPRGEPNETARAVTDQLTIAKKVLDDARPTEKTSLTRVGDPPSAGAGAAEDRPCSLSTDEPSVEPLESHSIVKEQQTRLFSTAVVSRRFIRRIFPSNTGESAESYAADLSRFDSTVWARLWPQLRLETPTGFRQPALQSPSPAPPVTFFVQRVTRRGGVSRKACSWSNP